MQTNTNGRDVQIDDVPDFASLIPFARIAKQLSLNVQTIHRWRLNATTPLRCWRVGKVWMTTDAEVRDHIRRWTVASTPGGGAASPPAAPHTARRRKQIQDAVKECERMGC